MLRSTSSRSHLAGIALFGSFGFLLTCSTGCSSAPSATNGDGADASINTTLPGDDAGANLADGEPVAMAEAGPPCSSDSDCHGGATCCGGSCANTSLDPANCGQCGNDCGNTSFCTGTRCEALALSNLCDNTHATVSLDQYSADNTAGAAIGGALTASCSPPTKVTQAAEDGVDVTDPTTGRPVTGVGNTFVAGGGSYGQTAVGYMQTAGLLPLSLQANDTNIWFQETKGSQQVGNTTFGALTAQHDFFAVEVGIEPISGTLMLAGIGMMAPGTAAAAYWMSSELIPDRSKYSGAWYVYEWTDTNADGKPDAADSFTLVSQGQ